MVFLLRRGQFEGSADVRAPGASGVGLAWLRDVKPQGASLSQALCATCRALRIECRLASISAICRSMLAIKAARSAALNGNAPSLGCGREPASSSLCGTCALSSTLAMAGRNLSRCAADV